MRKLTVTCAVPAVLLLACSGDGSGRDSASTSATSITTTASATATASASDSAGTDSTSTTASSESDSGDKFDINMETTGVGTTGECAEVSETAMNQKQPADIIFVVDTSGSMDFEAASVQNNLNGFSNQIIQSGIDVHVVLISNYEICINAPLGKPGGCGENPPDDNQPPLFTHVNQGVGSNSALQDILSTHDQWKDVIRPNSGLHLVVVSDDDSDMGSGTFDSMFKALNVDYSDYTFHGIVAPEEPFVPKCFPPLAAAKGKEYIDLINLTGGVLGDLCSQDFQPVFDQLSTEVIQGATLSCEWDIPDPPMGVSFDKDKVNVEFDDGMGGILDIGRVDSAAECANVTDAWYYDDPLNPTKILLCPQTCQKVQGFDNASVAIKFGCATKPAG